MSPSLSISLFVYGSLRSGFRSAAYDYISKYFNLQGMAKVKGKLFDMGQYPAALPSDEDSYIIGELYLAKNEKEFNWALAQLDDYEGVAVEPGEKQLYRRELVEVYKADGTTQPAWIYWYNGDVEGKPFIPSGDVIEYFQNKS